MAEAFRSRHPEIPRSTEGELPESKIFDLLSSVGNGEHKALELILMREGVIYSQSAMWHEVMNHQMDECGWEMDRGLPFKHCRGSLAPIGLVTREALRLDGTAWGYEITQYGLRTGVPFAGALLKWSYEHPEHSLYKMFGVTMSTSVKDEETLEKKRAQETRYKLLWEIATNPSNRIRITDVSNALNELPSLISEHVRSFSKAGVVSYEGVPQGKPVSYFRLKQNVLDQDTKPYRPYNSGKSIPIRVYNLITRSLQQEPSKYVSIGEIADRLIIEFPEYEDLNKKELNVVITVSLSSFERQGHVERQKFKNDFHSEITLLDEKREGITSLITVIDKFKNGDRHTIEEGRKFAQRVVNDSSLF